MHRVDYNANSSRLIRTTLCASTATHRSIYLTELCHFCARAAQLSSLPATWHISMARCNRCHPTHLSLRQNTRANRPYVRASKNWPTTVSVCSWLQAILSLARLRRNCWNATHLDLSNSGAICWETFPRSQRWVRQLLWPERMPRSLAVQRL